MGHPVLLSRTPRAESACALARSIHLDRTNCTQRFSLPVSKTDPQAIGCTRTWGCVCTSTVAGVRTACPYHAATALLDHHMTHFATAGALPADLPLFPGRDGGWCSRNGFLGTYRRTRASPRRLYHRLARSGHGRRAHLACVGFSSPCFARRPLTDYLPVGSVGQGHDHEVCPRRTSERTRATLP